MAFLGMGIDKHQSNARSHREFRQQSSLGMTCEFIAEGLCAGTRTIQMRGEEEKRHVSYILNFWRRNGENGIVLAGNPLQARKGSRIRKYRVN
jgi:hypothetical protein